MSLQDHFDEISEELSDIVLDIEDALDKVQKSLNKGEVTTAKKCLKVAMGFLNTLKEDYLDDELECEFEVEDEE